MVADADWRKIKLAFIRGEGTYKELADEYGVSYVAVKRRGAAEKWVEQRSRYDTKVYRNAEARAGAHDAEKLAALQRAGSEMCAQLETLMMNAQRELHTHVGIAGEVVTSKAVNDRKLVNISKSIETMTRAMRNLYDISTSAEILQMQMARAEMALKKREAKRKERETALKEKEAGDRAVTEVEVVYGGVQGMEAYHE